MPKDPYQYFRIEAKEIIESLSSGILELESGGVTSGKIGQLLRMAHTLKGASRVVKHLQISEACHGIEDLLMPFRNGGSSLQPEVINRVLKLLDEMNAAVKKLEGVVGDAPTSAEGRSIPENPGISKNLNSVRVDINDLDHLLDHVLEASVRLGEILGSTAWSEEQKIDLIRVEQKLAAIQDSLSELRLLPASEIFDALHRSTRDAAEALQKQIQFDAIGGDIRIDANVLRTLRDALLHIVRNSVAHGIESASVRAAANKPVAGRIRLAVERRGNRIAFVCTDDGQGIDLDAVRKLAISRGILAASQADELDMPGAIELLLKGGLSTTSSLSEVAGRGIGLDVVRDIVSGLKGDLQIRSEAGKGTEIDICVPISAESLVVLTVGTSEVQVSIPADSVGKALRLTSTDVANANGKKSILYEGSAIPLISLSGILGLTDSSPSTKKSFSVVVVRWGKDWLALEVSQLFGFERVIIRSLPPLLGQVPPIVGAALGKDGNPRLIVDLSEGVQSIEMFDTSTRFMGSTSSAHREPAQKYPILIIDDSMTSRMFEQSILEAAGFKVSCAVSGQDALNLAMKDKFSLFVVDVEMPGMSGFEFIERVQKHPALHHIPSVLVTSKAAPEDIKKGRVVGAKAHFSKNEFDEIQFLQVIRHLTRNLENKDYA